MEIKEFVSINFLPKRTRSSNGIVSATSLCRFYYLPIVCPSLFFRPDEVSLATQGLEFDYYGQLLRYLTKRRNRFRLFSPLNLYAKCK